MKRILIVLLALLLCGPVWAQYAYTYGDGTASAPYQIWKLEDLDGVRDHLSAQFVMMSDLNFDNGDDYISSDTYQAAWTSGDGWLPIGTSANPFGGVFGGSGKTLSSLFIDRSGTDYVGLFGYLVGTNISSLGLIDPNVTGRNNVAPLAGGALTSASTVEDCFVDGGAVQGVYAGGFMGMLQSISIIRRNRSSATVTGSYVGGFIGSINTGALVTECFSTGNVFTSVNGGGFSNGIGWTASLVENCFSTGNVTRTSGTSEIIGGFSGHHQTTGGGTHPIKNCYSTGRVIYANGTDPTNKGFLGTKHSGTETGCYWDVDTSLQTSTAGTATGVTTLNAYKQATFVDWDFTDVWTINEDVDYPRLQWEYERRVFYLAEGGKEVPSDATAYLASDTVTILGIASMARDGYDFVAWNTEPDGSGTSYDPDNTFEMPNSTVWLYAQWVEEVLFSGKFLTLRFGGVSNRYNTFAAPGDAGSPRISARIDGATHYLELETPPVGAGPRGRFGGVTYGIKNKE